MQMLLILQTFFLEVHIPKTEGHKFDSIFQEVWIFSPTFEAKIHFFLLLASRISEMERIK